MKRLFFFIVLMATAIVLSVMARMSFALPITIQLTGEVAVVDDFSGLLGGAIHVGDVVSGTYTYESTILDTNPFSFVGDYFNDSAPSGIQLSINGVTFGSDPNNTNLLVEIVNDDLSHGFAMDSYLVRSYTNLALSDTVAVDHIEWQLDDPTATALSSEALPDAAPVLADWQSVFGLTIDGSSLSDPFPFSERFFVRAHITEAAVVIRVPEPSTLWLFGVGLAGWALMKRILNTSSRPPRSR